MAFVRDILSASKKKTSSSSGKKNHYWLDAMPFFNVLDEPTRHRECHLCLSLPSQVMNAATGFSWEGMDAGRKPNWAFAARRPPATWRRWACAGRRPQFSEARSVQGPAFFIVNPTGRCRDELGNGRKTIQFVEVERNHTRGCQRFPFPYFARRDQNPCCCLSTPKYTTMFWLKFALTACRPP